MKLSFLKKVNSPSEKEGIHLNRRVITFFICLLISLFFWLMLALSKEYNMNLSFPVKYINLPKDKVLANQLPETIDIEIRSTGFNLLTYKFKRHRSTILIDITDSKSLPIKNHYYLFTTSRVDKITSQFRNEIKIVKIDPDTIFFNFNKKINKTVPVKANLTIGFDDNYQQTDSIILTPSFISISGAADVVDKINYVETVPESLKNIATTVTRQLPILITPDLKLVELSQSSVEAKVNIAKYTEGSIELPIEVENLPDGYSLKTFPDKVIVKYNVAFDDYEKINPLQFRAVVDYAKIEPGNNNLKVHLVKFPPEVRAIKLSTEKVEYIIRK